jgi:four helix bundle protein
VKESILRSKSFAFAIRVVKLSQFLMTDQQEFVMSKQLLRSGTAIGALVHEAEFGQSKPDFRSKMSIALKEANETHYWLSLLRATDHLSEKMFESIANDCVELIKMLVATVKTSKKNDTET